MIFPQFQSGRGNGCGGTLRRVLVAISLGALSWCVGDLSAQNAQPARSNPAVPVPATTAPTELAPDQGRLPAERRHIPSTVSEPVMSMTIQVVQERPGSECIYRSRHFEFVSPVKLGSLAMKDICRAFESTYELVSRLPWGIRPWPERGQKFFRAQLFETREAYLRSGAPPWSAGVYSLEDRIFRIPFDQVGVAKKGDTWAVTGAINNDVITHEVTHQMMHEYLVFMPIWLAEGTAEYTSNLPYSGGRYDVTAALGAFRRQVNAPQKTRRGTFATNTSRIQPKWTGVTELWGYTTSITERKEITSLTLEPPKPPVQMEPVSGSGSPPDPRVIPVRTPPPPQIIIQGRSPIATDQDLPQKLANRYFSSHALVVHFMHLDGDGTGLRLKKYFDAIHEERKKWPAFWGAYEKYKADATSAAEKYEKEWEAFKRLPGVVDMGGGRLQHPSHLTPPKAPNLKLPATPDNVDPAKVCAKHLQILLGGRTLEQLDAEVRAAFQKSGVTL